MKTLKSFEELECLLTEEQRNDYRKWKYCKNVLAQRPSYMRTEDFAFGIKKIGTDVKISLRVSQCH